MASSNRSLALSLLALVAGMVLLSFAAVPLYRIFCQVTGFGGTTQTATALPTKVLDRTLTISFNADHDPNLPWQFAPDQKRLKVRVGEVMMASYTATNQSSQPTTGMATYNVTPHEAGRYFHKIHCFCFEEQTLEAKRVMHMPLSFFIDPKMDEDPQLDGVKHITLSYTFFPSVTSNP